MGRCLSTPPKEVAYISSKSQSELMLQRSSSFNEQLRIIIDTDRYKPEQRNNPKYSTLDSVEHSQSNGTEISVSHTHSSSVDIIQPPNDGVTLMGFASNSNTRTADAPQSDHAAVDETDETDDKEVEESKSECSEDSEPSLIQMKGVTLMGIASPHERILSSNLDLNNQNSLLMHYLDHHNTVNPRKPVPQEIATPGC
mmetsp:Transcript_57133/g.91019  ORF Transcript_57133/g.91019 Transcript_57133/m.91019 type:complete len:198 (-) Transcript_57133:347-940(-)|eukprot:CAMPEP_0197032804 /NCGR_PEP_ID=MMETSP1384-20130603/11378_1 /TAXON_ID=29189 /ORGANISM="Ammonia sp." /LENGTH=197 /DNA_ID=CAMNT_0042462509 /DNA_START=85 /DNA_END=678 /DNA_ORIENTATION=+